MPNMVCQRCGQRIKSASEIADWLQKLLDESAKLALVLMIDGEERAGRLTAEEAEAERAAARFGFMKFQLEQLILGIKTCPHDKPARPSTIV